ncbi:MAG TPA: SRPBCC family protein [Candidatus Binatia bacterium]|jgi:uncharacterized protein YndB with AHSA1/START domain|nr:SRPBCC family protein [Candidatus Binatia bacterium]
MKKSSLVHASFSFNRTFKASKERVYKAFADKQAKELWFGGPKNTQHDHMMDFRVGGHESNEGKFHDGVTHRFEGTYYDIVPNERIIYAYEMYLNDQRISVSLATLEFEEAAGQTTLVLTEDGVFLDGLDGVESRKKGTEGLLSAIELSLKED